MVKRIRLSEKQISTLHADKHLKNISESLLPNNLEELGRNQTCANMMPAATGWVRF